MIACQERFYLHDCFIFITHKITPISTLLFQLLDPHIQLNLPAELSRLLRPCPQSSSSSQYARFRVLPIADSGEVVAFLLVVHILHQHLLSCKSQSFTSSDTSGKPAAVVLYSSPLNPAFYHQVLSTVVPFFFSNTGEEICFSIISSMSPASVLDIENVSVCLYGPKSSIL